MNGVSSGGTKPGHGGRGPARRRARRAVAGPRPAGSSTAPRAPRTRAGRSISSSAVEGARAAGRSDAWGLDDSWADELIDGDGEVGLTELPDDGLLDLVRLDVTRAAP